LYPTKSNVTVCDKIKSKKWFGKEVPAVEGCLQCSLVTKLKNDTMKVVNVNIFLSLKIWNRHCLKLESRC